MNPRFKIESRSSAATYHCMSHTVSGTFLDDCEREVLRKQLWQIADYCGLHILTYAIMSSYRRTGRISKFLPGARRG